MTAGTGPCSVTYHPNSTYLECALGAGKALYMTLLLFLPCSNDDNISSSNNSNNNSSSSSSSSCNKRRGSCCFIVVVVVTRAGEGYKMNRA